MAQEEYNKTHSDYLDDDIDIKELVAVLWKGRLSILSLTGFALIFGVIYSLLLPNIYVSKGLLAPTTSSGTINSALQQYSGLAGLAGVNVPTAGGELTNSQKAYKKLTSLSFFQNEIMPFIFLPNLMALDSWESRTNSLIYDKTIFDINSNTWMTSSPYSLEAKPSAQASFSKFKEHITLNEDDEGFIQISVKHQSPFIAKKWSALLIDNINSFYKQKDKLESEKAVSYLNEKLATTNLSELKQSINNLLQDEIQKLTLIEATESYVYEFIDYPAVMEFNDEPNRIFTITVSFIFGLFSSMIFVLAKYYFTKD